MAEFRSTDVSESPSIAVRLYEQSTLVRTELCDDEREAALVIEAWEELPGRLGMVSDLAGERLDPSSLEIDPADLDDDALDLGDELE